MLAIGGTVYKMATALLCTTMGTNTLANSSKEHTCHYKLRRQTTLMWQGRVQEWIRSFWGGQWRRVFRRLQKGEKIWNWDRTILHWREVTVTMLYWSTLNTSKSGMWASMLKTCKREAGQHITAQGQLSMLGSGAEEALMATAPTLL